MRGYLYFCFLLTFVLLSQCIILAGVKCLHYVDLSFLLPSASDKHETFWSLLMERAKFFSPTGVFSSSMCLYGVLSRNGGDAFLVYPESITRALVSINSNFPPFSLYISYYYFVRSTTCILRATGAIYTRRAIGSPIDYLIGSLLGLGDGVFCTRPLFSKGITLPVDSHICGVWAAPEPLARRPYSSVFTHVRAKPRGASASARLLGKVSITFVAVSIYLFLHVFVLFQATVLECTLINIRLNIIFLILLFCVVVLVYKIKFYLVFLSYLCVLFLFLYI